MVALVTDAQVTVGLVVLAIVLALVGPLFVGFGYGRTKGRQRRRAGGHDPRD